MRVLEVSTPEANRPGSRLQPERIGAVWIWRDSACLPVAPAVVAAKANSSGFVGVKSQGSVHSILNLVEPTLRNHDASLSAKFNQVCVDRQRYNSPGSPFTPGFVSGHDELTKRQGFLPAMGFHGLSIGDDKVGGYWGVSPMREFMNSASTGFWTVVKPSQPQAINSRLASSDRLKLTLLAGAIGRAQNFLDRSQQHRDGGPGQVMVS
jgi:hypothetical protein